MPRSGATPAIPSASVQDLRAHSMPLKREKESKSKWSPKWAAADVPTVKLGPNNTVRPKQRCSQKAANKEHYLREKAMHKTNVQKKRPVLKDDDSSADDNTSGGDDGPQPEEEDYKYSFDVARGLADGNDILGLALTKAVERYHDQETIKLVNDEYEILNHGVEDQVGPIVVDEDEFELI